jgi:exoribonuclease R
VNHQEVSIDDEDIRVTEKNVIEDIPQTIFALLDEYSLYSVDIACIKSGNIDKNYAIVCGRLCISSKTRWGVTSKGLHKYTFRPRDRSYPTYVVASKLKPSQTDVYARVEITTWLSGEAHPKASVVDIIGDVSDVTVYENVIIASGQVLPRNRNTVHRSEGKKFQEIDMYTLDFTIDEDWTGDDDTVSIDPDGSKDIDDALSVRSNNGVLEYAVHIATPTIWFEKDSAIDKFASSQITSIYTDTTTHNLLPNILSTDKASLVEGEPRYCLSVVWSSNGTTRLVRTKIKNKHAYSYDESESTDEFKRILDGFRTIWKTTLSDSHELVEQSMIKANTFVAEYLVTKTKETALLRKSVNNSAWYLPWNSDTSNNHTSLDIDLYTHFTSPLRRYADQLVHRQLFALLSCDAPDKTDNKTIIQMNMVKNKTKTVDSEMKWIKLANPETCLRLNVNVLYFQDGNARVELPEYDDMRMTIPIISHKIEDIVKFTEYDNAEKINFEYTNCDYPLTLEIGKAVIDLHWNQNQGLEGFRFEWIEPCISEWLSAGNF